MVTLTSPAEGVRIMPAPKPYTSQPLPLAGVRNTRDLGGFPFVDEQGRSGTTARGVFLRSGSLTRLTLRDRDELEAYGLVRVVDVRSNFELRFLPDPYARRPHPGVSYAHIPLMDQLNSNGFAGLLPESMFASYRDLLDGDAPNVGRVMAALDVPEGCVLFHCRVGKDRTGVICMLLLELAGVPRANIVADYAVTQNYMGGFLRLQRAAVSVALRRRVPRCLFEADPREMERTIDHLHGRYGGARRYLVEQAGCDPVLLDRLAARLRGRA